MTHINEKIRTGRKYRRNIMLTFWVALFAVDATILWSKYSEQMDCFETVIVSLSFLFILMIIFCFISLIVISDSEDKYDLAKWRLKDIRKKDEAEYKIEKRNASKKYTTIEKTFITLKNAVNVMLIIGHILLFTLIFFHR